MSELLRVENFHVAVGGKTLLHGINLTVNTGEVHVIMGGERGGKIYAAPCHYGKSCL